MKIISHRRNTLVALNDTPVRYGVEVDIRSQGDALVIHHDPYVTGEDFEAWISAYRHGTLILNVKEEGLESRLLRLMASHGIEDFFFLDQSFPFLIKTARAGEPRCAVRISEYESVDTALSLAGMVKWVWVDCFLPGLWLSGDAAQKLKDAGLLLCLVSPELQGRTGEGEIEQVQDQARKHGIAFDAVCTKVPARWE